ncbi:gfo/Idh/MocA family oxidoreductase [Paenibacillus sp. LMG 31456]|uniref:Gfo/Idh/MocA family oxidoreductase n=1 Tax=Paenibacillus foliorum TaxID=2654974 RepID=A0A972H0S9_9BACL|nr:Gfo/Idh/MocA family oxidoreductase [Paenibacillus foliorum]NOU94111.1 gfo/Idh/MocA family oxidoreductase [Paenibacillus foliorum]
MRNKTKVGIGLIGYKFMGKAHSHAYRDLPFFFETGVVPELRAIAGRDEDGLKKAAEKMGWQSYETDWRQLLERDDIDIIDICTPNISHAEIAIAAAEAGKHLICEKPLAMSVKEAKSMLQAVKKAGVVHMICHNYRFAPAVQWAKQLIDQGRIGKINHIRAVYLQDWLVDPYSPYVWRLNKQLSGSGTHGDLAAHIIDLARFLVGEFQSVVGMMETFTKMRCSNDGMMKEVDVDDASVFLARFRNGAIGTFEATRVAGGNRNANRFEINGDKGSIRWDFENMNQLQLYLTDDPLGMQGFRTINCTESCHPYAAGYWPSGHIIGYEHTFINLAKELMDGISKGYSPSPNFEDGVNNQIVLESVEKSAQNGSWVNVS